MKRFHVHIAVENIVRSVDFYSNLFGHPPTVERDDYAKWLLDDPGVNFAISARGHAVGVNHFGFQVDSAETLAEMKARAEAASPDDVLEQEGVACCFSRSDKHWTIDPQGFAWEHFHTRVDVLEFGDDTATRSASQPEACCIPLRGSEQDSPEAKASCCIPDSSDSVENACCG